VSGLVQLFPAFTTDPDAALTVSGAAQGTYAGPPPGLWDTGHDTATGLPAGASVTLTPTTPFGGVRRLLDIVVQVGTRLGILVDRWLEIGANTSSGACVWTVNGSATSRAEDVPLRTEPVTDPSVVLQTWVRLQLVISDEQIALCRNGSVICRIPLPEGVSIPRTIGTLAVSTGGADGSCLSVLAMSDEVPDALGAAIADAEAAGLGEVGATALRVEVEVPGGLGSAVSAEQVIPGGRYQEFEHGLAYWSPNAGGVTVEGEIAELYRSLGLHKSGLGVPVADTQPGTAPFATRLRTAAGTRPAKACTMSRFERGVIAHSADTGTQALYGGVAEHWLTIGGPLSILGLPLGKEHGNDYGSRHSFEFGELYTSSTGAFAAMTTRLAEYYEGLGGLMGSLGRPRSGSRTVIRENGTATDLVTVELERGTIYAHGSSILHLPTQWEQAYKEAGGPTGPLGWVLEGPHTVSPTVSVATCEHGTLAQRSGGAVHVVTSIEVRMSEAVAPKIDDGRYWYGAKDTSAELIVHVSIRKDGQAVPGWDRRRFPGSGRGDKSLSIDGGSVLIPVLPSTVIEIQCEAWDWDLLSSNDPLGGITRRYDITTLWGEDGPSGPAYSETGDGGDGSVTYRYSIGLPTVAPSPVFRQDRWWQFVNKGTGDISRKSYSEAFLDVDGSECWSDGIQHPLDEMFYALVVKGLADVGTCYGMSKLAFDSLTKGSEYRLPLSRYATANQALDDPTFPTGLRDRLKTAHAQQVNAAVLGYCVADVLTTPPLPHVTLAAVTSALSSLDMGIMSMIRMFSGGHAVLTYDAIPNPAGLYSILVGDPNVPFAHNPDPKVSRIDFFAPEGWLFVNDGASSTDYYSDFGATLIFHIPGAILRSPSVTPMAALGLGVNQVLQAVMHLGGAPAKTTIDGNVHHPHDGSSAGGVGWAGGGASGGTSGPGGYERVPLLEASTDSQLFASTRLPGQVVVHRTATGVGAAHAWLRTRTVSACAEYEFTAPGQRVTVEVRGLGGPRPDLSFTSSHELSATLSAGAAASTAQRTGYTVSADVGTIPAQTARLAFPTTGTGAVLDGVTTLGSSTIRLQRAGSDAISRYQLPADLAGRRVEISPRDMASPFGAMELHGLGAKVLLTPIA